MSTVKEPVRMSKSSTKRFDSPIRATPLEANFVESDIGWIAIFGRDGVLEQVRLGFPSKSSLLKFLREDLGTEFDEIDWNPHLAGRIRCFLSGRHEDFRDVPVRHSRLTEFQSQVIRACRSIPCGKTASYGQLAAAVGHPGAARAVGTVMSSNPMPLIIPCHRVVGGQGSLGGYSGRGGLALKQQLLELESESIRAE